MHARRDRLDALGAEVVFLAFDTPEAIRGNMVAGVELAYPVIADPERVAYRAWGLERAPWWKIWLDPKVWVQYARLLLGGERIGEPGQDLLQLGGDFIVDAAGTIAYSRPQERDDRPPVGELIRALAELEG
jgi:peroxiredoxin